MKNRYWFTGLVLLSSMLLFQACSDDDPVSPDQGADVLLVVDIENYKWREQPREGYVFVSDEDGQMLDLVPYSGDSRLVLRNGEMKPEYVSMTIFDNLLGYRQLTTEFAIPVGSTRRVPDRPRPESTGSVSIQFQNGSLINDLIVSTLNTTYSYHNFVPAGDRYPVYGEAVDFYMTATSGTGSRIGAWLHDVRAGDRDTVDCGSVDEFPLLDTHRVGIPQGAASTGCNFYQEVVNGDYLGYLSLDYAAVDPESDDAVIAHLPTMDHTDLSINFYQWYYDSPETNYRTLIQGSLPESISILDGELEVVSSHPDSLVIDADFAWEQFKARWDQESDGSPFWLVKGPSSSVGWGLPEFPDEVAEALSEYPRENFLLSDFEVEVEATGGVTYFMGKSFSIDGKSWREGGWNEDEPWVNEVVKQDSTSKE